MMRKAHSIVGIVMVSLLLLLFDTAAAQTTAFTYQGKLTDSGNLANGSYDFQFKLFDALSAGTQLGTTQTLSTITVSNGSFSVQLDFGACQTCFDGAARFLEIAVRPSGGSTFTTLGPRQPISSTPYALKSQNAATADGLSVACVNCVTSSQIASVNGSAVSGTIPVASVPAGSGNYIQNQNASAQASANFNISGDGTANGTLSGNFVNAQTQYNLAGVRMLSAPGFENLFVGLSAGASNTTGNQNAFFGFEAGTTNDTSIRNAFFGYQAGHTTSSGLDNAFFGFQAGFLNGGSNNAYFGSGAGAQSDGNENAFFGYAAGNVNTANQNTFFGSTAGYSNNIGTSNAFFGRGAGFANTTGVNNSFFGWQAGSVNITGGNNTFIGKGANFNVANPTGNNNTLLGANARIISGFSNATAIGAFAQVTQSNSLVLGGITGANGGTSVNGGIGTSAPADKLHISGTGTTRARVESDSNAGLTLALNGSPKWSVATVMTATSNNFLISHDEIGSNVVVG